MSKEILKPKPLKAGDKVALIAPAGAVSKDQLDCAVASLRGLGLNCELGKSVTSRYGYLAGSDMIRARDVMEGFMDPSIHGIFCIRGGYGSQRILDLLDYDIIANNPKFFAGYSDITALHTSIVQNCGFITYHSPMAANFHELDAYSMACLKEIIFSNKPLGKLVMPNGCKLEFLVNGSCIGEICGGNLSILVSSLGTKYEINTKNKIVFIEEIGEEPYKIDRMLNQLRLSEKFDGCRGIILGSFSICKSNNLNYSLKVQDIIKDLGLKCPIVYNFPCGHNIPTVCLPIGSIANIDYNSKNITIK